MDKDQQKKLNTNVKSSRIKMLGTVISSVTTAAILTLGTQSTLADDTEVFRAGIPAEAAIPNVVFVIDSSGSMSNGMNNDNSGRSKIEIVKNTFEQLIFSPDVIDGQRTVNPDVEGMNFALMRFDDGGGYQGGYFLTGLRSVNNETLDYFWGSINGIEAGGFTPLAETAYEASRYFRGETQLYGATSQPAVNHNDILRAEDVANNEQPALQKRYNTPLDDAANQSLCGINNHLVILTDGLPTEDGSADETINNLANTTADCTFSEASNTNCLPQVAQHLYETDLLPDTPGDQKVITHTIAFDLSGENDALRLLRDTARNGNGGAYRANNANQLARALTDILGEIPETAMAFTRPATSVSSSNRFVNDNTVYFGLFQPEFTPLWSGNLKGYQFNSDGQLMDFSATPQAALDTDGSFLENAKSKWSENPDGANVENGGAAEQLLAQSVRRVFTQNSAAPTLPTLINFSVTNEDNISEEDFGDGVTNEEKIEIIQWATSRTSNPIGDPLHTTPNIVKYGTETSFGGDNGTVIFFSTNQGFLHAIDAESGEELMSFIPKSLLGNLRIFKGNESTDDHPYGLDGHISTYIIDVNKNGNIEVADGDKVLVIVGMRRGGSNYYALNVTNPTQPSLAWQITGGEGDFDDMGQSWAKPFIAKMSFGDLDNPTVEDVAFISGGYDTQYDELNNTISNPAGAAIYAVRLTDGACIWSAARSNTGCDNHISITGMTNSIPSTVTAIDLNFDDSIDRLYAIDIMGKIFRIDLNDLSDPGSYYSVDANVLADLSGETRRFYYSVDVAYTSTGLSPKLHLSAGSGHRAHPLASGSADKFFSVWDKSVFDLLPDTHTTITASSLTDKSDPSAEIPDDSPGWYFDMHAGEKVLAPAAATAGYLFFTTYTPPGTNNNTSCQVTFGTAKVYIIKLDDSLPLDIEGNGTEDDSRYHTLNSTGIPPAVTFLTLLQPPVDGGDDGGNGGGDGGTDDPNTSLSSQDSITRLVVGGELVNLDIPQRPTVKSGWKIQ